MSKFVIEVSNIKRSGPAFVYPGRLVPVLDAEGKQIGQQVEVSALGILVLDPSEHQDTSVKLTGEQFQKYSYDFEGKTEGKHGCERELALHAVDVETGERQTITFAEALEIIAADLNNDEAAKADQAKQAEEFAKAASDLEDGTVEA